MAYAECSGVSHTDTIQVQPWQIPRAKNSSLPSPKFACAKPLTLTLRHAPLWSTEAHMPKPYRSISAAVTLFFLAPIVAEFLLGDFPATWLPLLIILSPMYGGGALLIREFTRRAGRRWP